MMIESDGYGVFVGRLVFFCKVCILFLIWLYVVYEYVGGVLCGLMLYMMKYCVVSKVRGVELMILSEKYYCLI